MSLSIQAARIFNVDNLDDAVITPIGEEYRADGPPRNDPLRLHRHVSEQIPRSSLNATLVRTHAVWTLALTANTFTAKKLSGAETGRQLSAQIVLILPQGTIFLTDTRQF